MLLHPSNGTRPHLLTRVRAFCFYIEVGRLGGFSNNQTERETMFAKIILGRNTGVAVGDERHASHKLIECDFVRVDEVGDEVRVTMPDRALSFKRDECPEIYVMNNDGKTIDSFLFASETLDFEAA